MKDRFATKKAGKEDSDTAQLNRQKVISKHQQLKILKRRIIKC